MQKHSEFKVLEKNKLHYFYGSIIFAMTVAGAVLFYKPDLFTEVLALLVGLVGGYGIGKASAKKQGEG